MEKCKHRCCHWVILSIVILSIIGVIYYCSKPDDPNKRIAWVVNKVSKKLDLNDQQKIKLIALKDEIIKSHAVMHSDRDKTHAQIIKLLSESRLDQTKVNNMIDHKASLFQQRSPLVVAAFAEFYDGLNSNQKNRFKMHLQKHFEKYKKHH